MHATATPHAVLLRAQCHSDTAQWFYKYTDKNNIVNILRASSVYTFDCCSVSSCMFTGLAGDYR